MSIGQGKKGLSTISVDKILSSRYFSLLYKGLVMWGFLLTVNQSYALDLGQVAHGFVIQERHFTDMMKNKLSAISTKAWQVHKQKILDKTLARINRPQGVSLSRTTEARQFFFNPGITTSKDILGAKGEVLIPSGTKANPLNFIRLSHPLLLIDGDDEAQVAWGSAEPGLLVLVQGEPLNLSRKLNRRVYFDQYQKMIQKFGIVQVPARVSQQGNQLMIEEIEL